MGLQVLVEESKCDSMLVTLEATVVTGLEHVALEEIKEKVCKTLNASIDRGRVYFNIPTMQLPLIHELRSIDNVYVLISMSTNVPFTHQGIEEDVFLLRDKVDYMDVSKALSVWQGMNKFEGVLYPTEENYNASKESEIELRKLAKMMAQTRIGCETPEKKDNEQISESQKLKEERTRFNYEETKAYHEIDSRDEKDKVLKYRVTCVRNGTHCFGSQDVAYHVGGRLQDLFHWVVDLNIYDLEVVVHVKEDTMYYGIALTKESKHNRNIKQFGPTTLRATICYNMLRLAHPKPGEIIIDPMCGGGSIPIEGSLSFVSSFFLCGDSHTMAVDRTRFNMDELDTEERRNYIDVNLWDACHLPLKDSSVDVFISDLPFGKRCGSVYDNRTLYKKALTELARVVRCETGRAVLLTHDKRSMGKALSFASSLWKLARKVRINIGGLDAGVYILWRTISSIPTPKT